MLQIGVAYLGLQNPRRPFWGLTLKLSLLILVHAPKAELSTR